MKKVMTFLLLVLLCSCSVRPDAPDVKLIEPDAPVVAVITPTLAEEAAPEVERELAFIDSPEPCPISDQEIIMLAKVVHEESNVLVWRGTRFGVSYQARQAAVAWCALNRYDTGDYGDTMAEVLTAPYQFAYRAGAEYTNENLYIARDVVERWWAEKQGEVNAGRTLPPDYLFFHGDGRENYFRKEYRDTGEYWDWSLADPYLEGMT